jgi:hypothetical protein
MAVVPMPKAPIDEDSDTPAPQNDIGRARETPIRQSETKARAM